jgi:hypothetical protein
MIVAMLVSARAGAVGPSWGYLDYSRVWGHAQANEPTEGSLAHLSVPLDDHVFFAAMGERLEGAYQPPKSDLTERFEIASGAVGLHTVEGSAHYFVLLDYVVKERLLHAPGGDSGDRYAGVGFALGARWLVTPYLSIEPQYGLKGYIVDGFTKLDIAMRVLPHVWLTGGFDHGPFSGNEYSVGLRWAWTDYTPSHYPGARLVAAPAGESTDGLTAGQTLVTLRPLRPQVRPAAGAPEMAPIPRGSQIVLQESTPNEFGTWWRIVAGDQTGWIRETELNGRPEGP